jgi:hypothetical protein
MSCVLVIAHCPVLQWVADEVVQAAYQRQRPWPWGQLKLYLFGGEQTLDELGEDDGHPHHAHGHEHLLHCGYTYFNCVCSIFRFMPVGHDGGDRG